MKTSTTEAENVRKIYLARFDTSHNYRLHVWKVLTARYFQKMIPPKAAVLDLGCGYGEFINHIEAGRKEAIDLNPDAAAFLDPDVELHVQAADAEWKIPQESLDVIFTSNFFEHLRTKEQLAVILNQARDSLKAGGKLICLGPNIAALHGAYWHFWDHFLPLSHLSLKEGLELAGFNVDRCVPRFLPYTLMGGPEYPLMFVEIYLKLPLAWRLFGKQFLVGQANRHRALENHLS